MSFDTWYEVAAWMCFVISMTSLLYSIWSTLREIHEELRLQRFQREDMMKGKRLQ